MLCSIAYEKRQEGKVRLSRGRILTVRLKKFQETYWQKTRQSRHYIGLAISSLFTGKDWRDCYEEYHAMAEPDFDWDKEPASPPLESIVNG